MILPLKVLIVDDSEDDALLLIHALRSGGYESTFKRVDTALDLESALNENEWDIILADYSMPEFSAPAALNLLKNKKIEVPFIIVSGAIGEETAVSALREGAQDFINKDNLTRLVPAIERELRDSEVRRERRKAEDEKKKIETQLFQAQKMEAIGRLTGGVAHDFNNLLTVIDGYIDLSLSTISKKDPNFENLLRIRQATRRAESLTRQLLAFSRKQTLKPVVLDLNNLLQNMEEMLRRIIGEDIDLITVYAKDLNCVKADPSQMEQVVLNMIINSRDSMPDGGKITIETENFYIDEYYANKHPGSAQGEHVMLAVSDTGIGMDKKTKAHIFEPFFTTKEKGKGTGLGLSTVYGIVKQSGGCIYVYSEPGKGTTFKIFLKVIEENIARKKDRPQPAKKLHGNETILVVEDEEAVLELVTGFLKKYGYNVLEASCAEEALKIVKKANENIHLLLTDVVLPGISGHELGEKISSIKPGTKVIFTSGYAENAVGNHGILDENITLIQKPYSPLNLLKVVRSVLDKN